MLAHLFINPEICQAMKRILYTILAIVLLTACQQDVLTPTAEQGSAVLELTLTRAGRPVATTRAIDSDLALNIYKSDNTLFVHYAPGEVPQKIVLEPGTFRVVAYTDNQTTWKTGNGGKGEGCYYAETSVEMEFDAVTRLTLNVPMINYAVGLQLPQFFNNLFRSYTFTLKSGGRTTAIKEGERAYFDVADGGFTYSLRATNTDGKTSSHSAIEFPDVEVGKLFTVSYNYDSDATSGGVDIVITDDMETDDTDVKL